MALHEVSEILNIKEDEVIKLANNGSIPSYRIGGSLLRFKLKDIYDYVNTKSADTDSSSAESNSRRISDYDKETYRLKDRIYDFFYYYDFYIVISLILVLLLLIIFKF